MAKVYINGRELEVEEGKMILEAALENDIYIPHFCYHPHLPLSGNCRMCLVEIKPGPPKLVPSCMTPVQDGMEVFSETDKVKRTRQSVMEFILKNHPVDCPICDQAGECTLHEYYMAYDLAPSRLAGPEEKVKKRKARRMGKHLILDSERCVLCTRCIRFMRDVVKDECLVIVNRGDRSEVTAFPGEEVNNPYSLCLADVCPVGAWTSEDFRFKQRVWFLESSPSICPHCARGCNTWLDHQDGEVYRMRGRVKDSINKSWLCDEGRLSYHAINDGRLVEPRVDNQSSSWEDALTESARIMGEAGSNLVLIASASLSLEEGGKLLKLSKKTGGKVVLHAGPAGWEDEFLRSSDMNSNTKGLVDLGIPEKLEGPLGEDSVGVLFETLCPNPLPEGVTARVVVSPQLSHAVESAEVALPAASYAETSGTVVNLDGIEQSYEPAIALKGDARSHVDIMIALLEALEAASQAAAG